MELLDPSNTVFVAVLHLLHNRLSYASYLSRAVFHDSLRVPRTLALFAPPHHLPHFVMRCFAAPGPLYWRTLWTSFSYLKLVVRNFDCPLDCPSHVTVIAHSARPRSLRS